MAKAKILIVEDNVFICQLIEGRLRSQDYEAVVAIDGIEGLKKAKDEKPDLILLDINMPRMDGWEFGRRLKADEDTKSIPIIVVTAQGQQKDILKTKEELGAVSHIVKPFSPQVLLEEIKAVLKK